MHDFLCTTNEAALTTYNIGRTQTENIKRRLKKTAVAEANCTATRVICVHNLGVISLEDGLRRTIDWYKNNLQWVAGVRSREYLSYYEKYYENRESSLRAIARSGLAASN